MGGNQFEAPTDYEHDFDDLNMAAGEDFVGDDAKKRKTGEPDDDEDDQADPASCFLTSVADLTAGLRVLS